MSLRQSYGLIAAKFSDYIVKCFTPEKLNRFKIFKLSFADVYWRFGNGLGRLILLL